MAHYFNYLLGKYVPDEGFVGLDYSRLFLDSTHAKGVLFHELTHSLLCQTTDFGQGTSLMLGMLGMANSFTDEEKRLLERELFEAQDFVQESLATFMQMGILKQEGGRPFALRVLDSLPDEYQDKFSATEFMFNASRKYRELFTSKVSRLSMESGFRRHVVERKLLDKPEDFTNYFGNEDCSPDRRFQNILSAIRRKPSILKKEEKAICKFAGLEYFEPTSKREVADFITYVYSFTPAQIKFQEKDVGDIPVGLEAIGKSMERLIIANMNLNLQETAIPLFNLDDLLHYADKIEALFVNPLVGMKGVQSLERLMGTKLDVCIVAFLRTGGKFMVGLPKGLAAQTINESLGDKTLLTKWGAYSLGERKVKWLPDCRSPQFLIYNSISNMEALASFVEGNNLKVNFVTLGASEGHPFTTLLIRIMGEIPVHIVTTLDLRKIASMKETLKGNIDMQEFDKLFQNADDFNNLLSVWFGLPWDVNWFGTITDGKQVVWR